MIKDDTSDDKGVVCYVTLHHIIWNPSSAISTVIGVHQRYK